MRTVQSSAPQLNRVRGAFVPSVPNSMRLRIFPPPLAANRLVRTLSSHVARIVGRREGEFALEVRVLIS